MIAAAHPSLIRRALQVIPASLAAFTLGLAIPVELYAAEPPPWPPPKPASIQPQKPAPAPALPEPSAGPTDSPSACVKQLKEAGVAFSSIPDISGPGECGATDVVRVEALQSKLGSRVVLTPHAVVRCTMAEALAAWVRDEVSPALETPGAKLTGMSIDASFECRGRNRVIGAKVSQHGYGNAADVSTFTFGGGKAFKLTDIAADKDLRSRLKDAACERFTTVLGPGSDGYHESHIHLDIIERRGGYRLCQWDVRDAKDVEIAALERQKADAVPMPLPRPISAPPRLAEAGAAVTKPEPPPRRRGRAVR